MSNGIKSRKKIRIAFLQLGSMRWAGGVHYLRNLLYAVSCVKNTRLEPYVFIGTKADEKLIAEIKPFATIVETSLVDEKSLHWLLWKCVAFLFGSNCVLNRQLLRHKIDVVSHSRIAGNDLSCKLINWIPDFQHLHLPDMFSVRECRTRDNINTKMIETSDCLVVSSNDSASDLEAFLPGHKEKLTVLHFVSQPSTHSFSPTDTGQLDIEQKYGFSGKFFYLPNQFWAHKNHRVVFEAADFLKQEGLEVLILCSGLMDDYRNVKHVERLRVSLEKNNLTNVVQLLGMIDYDDVFILMQRSLAVINPSLFEGWSSTVEESRSLGKGMILSDIGVHREQNPPASIYFNPTDATELAGILRAFWSDDVVGNDEVLQAAARKELPRRTEKFGALYQDAVLRVLSLSKQSSVNKANNL